MSRPHMVQDRATPDEVFRFFAMVDASSGECWEWLGGRSMGYGSFMRRKTLGSILAHRFSWLIRHKDLPALPLCLDHVCRNRACVNPLHLEVVTTRENILRGNGVSAKASRKTHCSRGHEFTPENTNLYRGARRCRQCFSINTREWHEKHPDYFAARYRARTTKQPAH